MIYFYSGTPGSGKSLHVARVIMDNLKYGRKVIANFQINLPKRLRKKRDSFTYVDNTELTVDWLIDFAHRNHKLGREGQTVLIIDECAVMFNSRAWDSKDRNRWLVFFQQHRKLGYTCILVAQNDRMVDRQIRANFEYEVKHRSLSNFGTVGFLVGLVGIKLFCAISYWYGMKERLGAEFYRYRRRDSKLYDTYALFSLTDKQEEPAPAPAVLDRDTERKRRGTRPSAAEAVPAPSVLEQPEISDVDFSLILQKANEIIETHGVLNPVRGQVKGLEPL